MDAAVPSPGAPRRLRELGTSAWLLVGIAAVLAGAVWLLGQASAIVGPLLVGGIVAVVASPVVGALDRRGVSRGWGALLVLLAAIAVTVVLALLVLGGIVSQSSEIAKQASAAAAKAQGWLQDAGVSQHDAATATDASKSAAPTTLKGLAQGFVAGARSVAALALGISFTAFSLFFLLKDGPALHALTVRRLPFAPRVAEAAVTQIASSLRRYFLGVTLVASFNALVVGVGAWLLGVPLAGTIAVVTLATAYVPFIGAVVGGAFAVILALGGQGTGTAVAMLVIVLLANGLLQNVFQPIAFGAALEMNPLLSLVVTVGFGSILGMVGLVLAAPLTAAALHLARDLPAVAAEPETPPVTAAAAAT